MQNLKDNLYWQKYRPQTLQDVIIPDRIRRVVEQGVLTNMIFTGSPGCGKTTCAKILLQNYHHITLSAKLGVDVLRNEVDKFCKDMIVSFDAVQKHDKIRVVYFEEFDRASKQLQEELKSFIEDKSEHVRFLATCNNISQISEPIQSRFNVIDFTPLGAEETKELRNGYLKRILEVKKAENIEIENADLKEIIVKRFPDFRKIWQDLQYYKLSGGHMNAKSALGEEKLFELILDKSNPIQNWDYLFANWSDKVPVAIDMLGKGFFSWLRLNHPMMVNKLGDHIITLSEYSDVRLPQALDPFITLTALVFKLQKIYNE
jgi:replication-associated recombination protein RarA